ncbi:hypothetical protein [Dongia sp.]|uniref:hypothetical protein n=1 Tax=Dongia sp. TaxID=1977262 RepID=UPI0037531F2B
MSTSRSIVPLALSLLSFLAAPLPAAAQGAGDPILEANGIKYACAGVGKASRGDPRWKSFPVRLEFAAANGDFLGDPDVTITDAGGKQVFQAKCNGPWVLIELPAGSYKVHATGQKAQYSKDFDLAVKAGGQTKKTIRLP